MSTLDVTNLKSKLALTPTKFYDKDDKEIGTLCRAWVNFNGTGIVAIRASFNVSSITDNGTGDYTVNFTNAMPDANYSCNVIAQGSKTSLLVCPIAYAGTSTGGAKLVAPTASAVRLATWTSHLTEQTDTAIITVQVFR